MTKLLLFALAALTIPSYNAAMVTSKKILPRLKSLASGYHVIKEYSTKAHKKNKKTNLKFINGIDFFAGIKDLDNASIKERYKKLANTYHPDKTNGDILTFQILQNQYEKRLRGEPIFETTTGSTQEHNAAASNSKESTNEHTSSTSSSGQEHFYDDPERVMPALGIGGVILTLYLIYKILPIIKDRYEINDLKNKVLRGTANLQHKLEATVTLYEETDIRYLRILLKAGADANYEINGVPLLHCTVDYNNFEATKLLLKYGAVVNKKDKYGQTALHRVVRHRKKSEDNAISLVTLLLRYGADPTSFDGDGKTAGSLAGAKKFDKLIPLLNGGQPKYPVEQSYDRSLL